MRYTLVDVCVDGAVARVTLNHVARRNALSFEMLTELRRALGEVAASDATGMVLGARGPVFSSGHDFADVGARDALGVADLLAVCTDVMQFLHAMPQVVIGRIQGLATGGGCQLAASTDLAVAGRSAGFQLPGGAGGWFCHTPSVPVARAIGRKRLMEMALTGDVIDAETAADWGLVNRAVDDDALDDAVAELLTRATRGSAASKAWGKRTLYAQLDRPERDAYGIAGESMTAASQTASAQEAIAAFVGKRPPRWSD